MSHPLPEQSRNSHNALGDALSGFGRYRKLWELIHGTSRFVIAGPGLLLLWFGADVLFQLPAWLLLLSFFIVVLIGAWTLAFWVLKPQLRPIDLEHEAIVIERLHGKLDNQLIGALQLGREVAAAPAGVSLGYSPDFVSELLLHTGRRLESLQVRALLDLGRAKKTLAAAAIIVVLMLCCGIFAGNAVQERLDRLKDAYALILDTLFPVEIRVEPGDISVIRGRSVKLQVSIPGARRHEVRFIREKSGSSDAQAEILKLVEDHVELTLDNAQDSLTYRFEYGNRKSATYSVRVGDLPDIKTINYEMTFPAYTGQPSRTLTGRVPRLRGLVGTSVLVSFAATTDLHPDLSYVEWQDGSRQPIEFSGRFGHFAFNVSKADRATICLTSALARPPHEKEWRMEHPIAFDIDVQRDEAPTIQILLKNKKMTMFAEQAALFGFEWMAEDDFGVAEVTLDYRIEAIDELLGRQPRKDSRVRMIEPPRERVKDKFVDIFKTLSPPLEPGDKITITVTAKDNNSETGPGVGRSQSIEIVVVRPDLGAFVEQNYKFGQAGLMGDMVKVKRSTDLLVDPEKTVRTEKVQKIERKEVKTLAKQEGWPSGSEDATGDYFRLLSGEK